MCGVRFVENYEADRLQIFFGRDLYLSLKDKLSRELKGWNFSKANGCCWQRKLTGEARYSARCIIETIKQNHNEPDQGLAKITNLSQDVQDKLEQAAVLHRRHSELDFKILEATKKEITIQVVQGKSPTEKYFDTKRLVEIVHETFDRFSRAKGHCAADHLFSLSG